MVGNTRVAFSLQRAGTMSTSTCGFLITLALFASACTSPHHSQLDGPVDYNIGGGFIQIANTAVHVELDGAATKEVTFVDSRPPIASSGTVDSAKIATLRADVAAVDLESFPDAYDCTHFHCIPDLGHRMFVIRADGEAVMVFVGAIDEGQLPAGLVKILGDLDAMTTQLP